MDLPLEAVGPVVAAAGLASGLVYRTPTGAACDRTLFDAVNGARLGAGVDRLFGVLRFLGTAWAVALLALGLAVRSPWLGLSFGVAGLVSGILERGIKALVRRRRPFEAGGDAHVRQVPPPADPGYPSADASRVWFLAVGIGLATGWSPSVMAAASFVAVVVSLGRVRMGVHYPLDVWAGACLGFGLGLIWAGLVAG